MTARRAYGLGVESRAQHKQDNRAMLQVHRAYLLRETAISTGVNSVLSLAFALLAAHGRPTLPLWGGGGMAVDFVPQLFMMTFATTLAVTLLTRKRRKAGKVIGRDSRPPPLPRNAVLRAITLGLIAVVILAPLSIGALLLAGVASASTGVFVVSKVIYGAIVSILIAPPITLAVLSEAQATPVLGANT